MQWEKLRQSTFQDSDQFFQKFKELAYDARIRDNKQVMLAQVKRAAQEMSKNTIYSANRELPITYQGWKARLLRMDYNWCQKRAEGMTAGRTDSKSQVSKTTMPQKGGQMLKTPEKKTATGTTYGGSGVPMDINAVKATAKCYQCRKLSHFKCDCPHVPKTREEAMHQLNTYWDHHPMEEKLATVEEVKEDAEE